MRNSDVRGYGNFELGRVMLEATSTKSNGEVFIGIARTSDVNRYLADVHRTEITEISFGPREPRYRDVPGTQEPALPGDQDFRLASASGSGTQRITASLETGSWAVVVMNADASQGVQVDVRAGIDTWLLTPVGWGLLIAGIIVLLGGIALTVVGGIRVKS